jgi:hypothetical protein
MDWFARQLACFRHFLLSTQPTLGIFNHYFSNLTQLIAAIIAELVSPLDKRVGVRQT